MRMIKALVTGHKNFGITLDHYLHDLKYECIEDIRTTTGPLVEYRIDVPEDKRDRIISAQTFEHLVQVKYSNQVLESLELIAISSSYDDVSVMKVDYKEQTFMIRINSNDVTASIFKFEDMRSSDFIFNFDIEFGFGEAIKDYMQEIDWFFTEYGFRTYLQ